MIAKVAVNRPVRDSFDYKIPYHLIGKIKRGQRVLVNFRGARIIGYVVNVAKESKIEKIRKIEKVIDKEPLFDEELLKLTKKVCQYYLCSWGEVLEAAVPSGLKKDKTILKTKKSSGGIIQKHKSRNIKGVNFVRKFVKDFSEEVNNINQSYQEIINNISKGKFKTFLYQPLNQQNKIDFYLKLIRYALRINKRVLLLVPEVLSVDILTKRLEKFYPQQIAVLHSRLKQREKQLNLKLVQEETARIVIGTRSAVFSPIKDLGLIIVDEEQSDFFKQPDTPKFNAKKVALFRAEITKCPLILSSLTPSVESYYYAKRKKYTLIQQKVKNSEVKKIVNIIDLKNEKDALRRKDLLSFFLKDKIEESLSQNRKIILFLNRRGFSTFISCRKCGYIARCKRCQVSLTYHFEKKKLLCHHCNYEIEPSQICPQCKSSYMKYSGMGTEKLESVLCHMYPQKRISRIDIDAVSKKGQRHKILSAFNNGEIDILIGTQILFKGINFKDTGIIGVLLADSSMHMPNFRAQEKTFDTLYNIINQAVTQNKEVKVIIQTYLPSHFAINRVAKNDYLEFYKEEIEQRRSLNLPPFYHFNYITLRGKNKNKVIEKSQNLSQIIKRIKKGYKNIKLVEAHPMNISKVRGKFRQNIIIKGKDLSSVNKIINKGLSFFKKPSDIIMTIDIDAVECF